MIKITKHIILLTGCILYSASSFSQPNNNGTLDKTEEFTTKYVVPFTMPDGTKLMTDVYLPIVRDSFMMDVNDTISDTVLIFGINVPINIKVLTSLQVIKKNTQIIIYDSINTGSGWGINPNYYQLPLVFTRTPYGKGSGYEECTGSYTELGEGDATGALISLLGYGYAMQDMRGRYTSEGVYLPMYSDSWKKGPYHPTFSHTGDITSLSDQKNGNNHEDGYNSIKFLSDSLTQTLLAKYGTTPPASGFICNGSIGMFGASALGNTQLQAAAAHEINPTGRGLKGLLPVVASNEHYRFTGYQNGVFRERIITGWLKGQIMDLTDPDDCQEEKGIIVSDNDIQNSIHTPADYALGTKFQVADLVADYWTTYLHDGKAAAYPNSSGRPEMDCSRAWVDANGDGSITGAFNRYRNARVPSYHLTGWWDIFVDGQIETVHHTRFAMDSLYKETGDPYFLKLKKLQKIVIGPWAHQTVAQTRTGDMQYRSNVTEITKIDPDKIDLDNLPLNEALQSEFLTWFRQTLNYNSYKTIGEPKFFIPESNDWQYLGFETVSKDTYEIRIPADDISDGGPPGYKVPFIDFFRFLAGSGGLKKFPVEIRNKKYGFTFFYNFDVPATDTSIFPGLDSTGINNIVPVNYADAIKPFRFYVIGPNCDINGNCDGVPENDTVGNFWMAADTFPITDNIFPKSLYLSANSALNYEAPTNTTDIFSIYIHDPDDPVKTVGGGNMIVDNMYGDDSNGDNKSQGQRKLSDPRVSSLTMDREGVLKFETLPLDKALCAIGFPVATLWAKTNPAGAVSGPTDTDFNVRILDVYPNGDEFFVAEGCVNARARNYARTLAENPMSDFRYKIGSDGKAFYPADTVAITNINIGQLYEYHFRMLPLAYVWGKNHKIKILITSSNHPRYQSNPNIPMDDGKFFRRIPNDGLSTTFNGQPVSPRKAVQRIAISSIHPSHIELPVYTGKISDIKENAPVALTAALNIYPNPASKVVTMRMSKNSDYEIRISDMMGKIVYKSKFKLSMDLDIKNFNRGVYFVEVYDKTTQRRLQDKFIVM